MGNLTPANHSFQLVVASYGGVRISGFADQGDPISYAPNGEDVTSSQGPDGETVINKMAQRNSRLTLRLMAGSGSVDYLSDLYNVHRQPGFRGPYPACNVTDANTGSTITAAQAWIVGAPPVAYGSEAGVVEFVIEGGFLQVMRGALI